MQQMMMMMNLILMTYQFDGGKDSLVIMETATCSNEEMAGTTVKKRYLKQIPMALWVVWQIL
jgi:hypothetical protein